MARVAEGRRLSPRARRDVVTVLLTSTVIVAGAGFWGRADAQEAADASGVTLAPVVLHGDRTGATLGESQASVTVVPAVPEDSPTPATIQDAFRRAVNVDAGSSNDTGFILRGINSEGLVPGGAGAPLASLYIDGVQQTTDGTRRGARGMFDVEQLEIYRGPQSTLSGRAALAGALYLRTVDPEFERSGAAQLTFGSDQRRQVGVAFGDTLGANLAYRISGEWSSKETDLNYPSYERFERYDDFAHDDYRTLRAKLLWLPMGDQATRVLFSYSHTHDSPGYDSIVGPGWSSAAPGYDARRGDYWGSLSPDWVAGYGLSELPAYQESRWADVDNFGIEATHDISDNLRFTALTGYSNSLTNRDSINVGTPGEFLVTMGEFDQKILSQEFRLNYDAPGMKWVLGLYGGWLENEAWRESRLFSSDKSRNTTKIDNLAVFGEATWEFTPGWSLIAGGRLDWIEQRQNSFFSTDGSVSTDTSTEFSDTVFLPKLGLEYAFLDGQTLSLIYQEGYRQGGAGVRFSDGVPYDYDPEYAKTLELAWRARFMEDRVTVAANVFYQDWDQQQIEVLADPADFNSGYIANAGKSESRGAELEVTWAATDELNLFTAVGLLDTEFKDFDLGSSGDFSGMSFPYAPERMIALGFRWAQQEGWFVAGAAKYVSSAMSGLESAAAPVELSSYTTVDAEFGYAWDKAQITAYATNLFDKQYFVYESGPDVLATLGDRREIGVRLDYRF